MSGKLKLSDKIQDFPSICLLIWSENRKIMLEWRKTCKYHAKLMKRKLPKIDAKFTDLYKNREKIAKLFKNWSKLLKLHQNEAKNHKTTETEIRLKKIE